MADKCLPCKEICACMTYTSLDDSVSITKNDCTFNFEINLDTLPTVYIPADGSETIVTEGTAIEVTGDGTSGDPYVITNTGVTSVNGSTGAVTIPTLDGTETKVTAGTGTTVTGNGSVGSPYVITCTVTGGSTPDGTETKVTAGTAIGVSGDGSIATPYIISNTGVTSVNGSTGAVVIPTYDGSETKLTAGTNVTITGLGTVLSPYIINSSTGSGSTCASTILPYTGAACCKSLDTAMIFAGGLIASNNSGSCRIDTKLRDLELVDIGFELNFGRLFDITSGLNREGLIGLYKPNIFLKCRGYMTWDVFGAVPTTPTWAFTMAAPAQAGAQVAYPTPAYNNRDFFVHGIAEGTQNVYVFLVRYEVNTNKWYIQGMTNVTYPVDTMFEINMENCIVEMS